MEMQRISLIIQAAITNTGLGVYQRGPCLGI